MDEVAQLRLDKARLELHFQNPHVPFDVIRAAPAQTPEELTAFVATLATAMPRQQAQPPAGAPVPGLNGGAPVPGDNAARAAESEDARRIREGQYKVRQRPGRAPGKNRTLIEPWEAEELRDQFFRLSWNNHQAARAHAAGRGEEAARRASNVSGPPSLPFPGSAI